MGRLASGEEAKLCRVDASKRAMCRSKQNRATQRMFKNDEKKRKLAYKMMKNKEAERLSKHPQADRPPSRQIREAMAQQKHEAKMVARRQREATQVSRSATNSPFLDPIIEADAGLALLPHARPSPQQSPVGWRNRPSAHNVYNLLSPHNLRPERRIGFQRISTPDRIERTSAAHRMYPDSVPTTALHNPTLHSRSSTSQLSKTQQLPDLTTHNSPPDDRASTTPHRKKNTSPTSGSPKDGAKSPDKEGTSRIDCGSFIVDDANPVRDKHTGAIQTFDQVYVETQQVLTRLNASSKPLRQMMLSIPGQDVSSSDDGLKLLDLSAIVKQTGFDQPWLESLARDFMSVVHCRLDLLLKSEDGMMPKMDWPQFRIAMRKRLMCCEQMQHRIFEICDSDKTHNISFSQLCIGLQFFQPNNTIKSWLDLNIFIEVCTRFMDADHCGIITKLAMLTVCDTAFERDQSYLLADALWEVLSCVGGEMSTESFSIKLAESKLLRVIFSKLLLLQGLPPPPEDYEERKFRKGPTYVHELNIATKREVLELCAHWCNDKKVGQFFFLDEVIEPFMTAAEDSQPHLNKRRQAGQPKSAAETQMQDFLQQATQFQNSKRGNDNMKTGHYCKVMLGVQAKGTAFLPKEIDRVRGLQKMHDSGERVLTERQIFKFVHYLHILRLFLNPPKVRKREGRKSVMLKERKERVILKSRPTKINIDIKSQAKKKAEDDSSPVNQLAYNRASSVLSASSIK